MVCSTYERTKEKTTHVVFWQVKKLWHKRSKIYRICLRMSHHIRGLDLGCMFGVTLVLDKIKVAFRFCSGYHLSPSCAKQTSTRSADVGMYGVCCDNTFTVSESTRVAYVIRRTRAFVGVMAFLVSLSFVVLGLQLDRKNSLKNLRTDV